ncbi:hypothetical protein [Acetobacter fabarum]|uniref:hypothetical protein n=1 Tax=Acetobacter fabarum TaxID=483199 RepID=UPI0039E7D35D
MNSIPPGYKAAYCRPVSAREWTAFGSPALSPDALRQLGKPQCIEIRDGDVIILCMKVK